MVGSKRINFMKLNKFLFTLLILSGRIVLSGSDIPGNPESKFFMNEKSGTNDKNVAGNNYYVSANGNNSNPGTTPALPFKTIAAASALIQPGDIVYLMNGSYGEVIRPARSGSAGNSITYKKYQNETPTISGGATNQADLSDRSYIIIDGISFTNAPRSWVLFNAASTYNRITNCNFYAAYGWAGFDLGNGGSYNQFDHNTMDAICTGGSPPVNGVSNPGTGGPGDMFWMTKGAHHNLIEFNTILKAYHYGVNIQGGWNNVVRNNIFKNRWHAAIGLYAQYYGPVYENLIDQNTVLDAGEDNQINYCKTDGSWTWLRWNYAGLQVDATTTIIRRNIFINNGETNYVSFIGPMQFNRIYNNSFAQNYRGIYFWGDITSTYQFPFSDNAFKNNIFYMDMEYGVYAATNGTMGNSLFQANNFYGEQVRYRSANGSYTLSETQYPTEWMGNFNIDPKFVNINDRDLHLQPSSGLINKGAFLTKIIGSGNSTTITVADSYYFTDGYGIVPGDSVQLEGSTQTARITGINRSTNTLTLSSQLTFTNGQGISLLYSGSSPDIGSYEYGQAVAQGVNDILSDIQVSDIQVINTSYGVKFKICNKKSDKYSLFITDITGKRIWQSSGLNNQCEPFYQEWNSAVSNGIYFITLQTWSENICKRFAYLKN